LLAPADGSQSSTRTPTLDWTDSTGATSYNVQVRRDSTTGRLVVNKTVSGSQYTTPSLAKGYWYYWHVRACNPSGCSDWTSYWSFEVE
jgi:hypothetical protein